MTSTLTQHRSTPHEISPSLNHHTHSLKLSLSLSLSLQSHTYTPHVRDFLQALSTCSSIFPSSNSRFPLSLIFRKLSPGVVFVYFFQSVASIERSFVESCRDGPRLLEALHCALALPALVGFGFARLLLRPLSCYEMKSLGDSRRRGEVVSINQEWWWVWNGGR